MNKAHDFLGVTHTGVFTLVFEVEVFLVSFVTTVTKQLVVLTHTWFFIPWNEVSS